MAVTVTTLPAGISQSLDRAVAETSLFRASRMRAIRVIVINMTYVIICRLPPGNRLAVTIMKYACSSAIRGAVIFDKEIAFVARENKRVINYSPRHVKIALRW